MAVMQKKMLLGVRFSLGLGLIFMRAVASADNVDIYNYLGTSSTNLHLTLSDNGGDSWGHYDIAYQAHGGLPCNADPTKQWSSWDVRDDQNNYYGSITLNSDCHNATYVSYSSKDTNGYGLGNISVAEHDSQWQLTTSAVITPNTTPLSFYNDLGTGAPSLYLVLGNNGDNWNSYQISYQSNGNLPCSPNGADQWSSWNVYDGPNGTGNYYGSITLNSDCNSMSLTQYAPPADGGAHLGTVSLSYDSQSMQWQLTTNGVYPPPSPFPDVTPSQPALYPNSNTPIILSTSGRQIVDNAGDEIILKGIVRPSLEWNKTGQYLSEEDMDRMSQWREDANTCVPLSQGVAHPNVVRLDLNEVFWLSSDPESTLGSYRQIVDAVVSEAIQHHMAVILDLHWTAQNQSGQSWMADQDSVNFWKQVADKYKNYGTVIFELYNEPVNITPDIWLSGGVASDGNTYVGYQTLYDAVREEGADNLVIIGGLDYAWDLSFLSNSNYLIQADGHHPLNVMYNSHPYDANKPAGGDSIPSDLLTNYPLIFTEFGDNIASDYPAAFPAVYQNIMSYIDANHINYTGFAWWGLNQNNGHPEFPVMIQDMKTPEPVNGGCYVHADMMDHPGTDLSQLKPPV